MKKKTNAPQYYTAARFAVHFKDTDLTWQMGNISEKSMKELDKSETSKTELGWLMWFYDNAMKKGRRLEYDRVSAHLRLTMIGNRP